MSTTNGSTNGVHHTTDEAIDLLYSWMPGLTPAPAPCPEAVFSLTLRGTVNGVEALLTARGQTASEFRANLEAIRGLLDPTTPAPTAISTGRSEGLCPIHTVQMTLNQKEGRSWWSHRTAEGMWCKGK